MASGQIAVEFEQEDDGRWIAEVPTIPGALASGETPICAAIACVNLVELRQRYRLVFLLAGPSELQVPLAWVELVEK